MSVVTATPAIIETYRRSALGRHRSHKPCDQVATNVLSVSQIADDRRRSQINRATSRGGRGQSRDQKPVAAISDRTRSHTGRT